MSNDKVQMSNQIQNSKVKNDGPIKSKNQKKFHTDPEIVRP
jgi:hypothetical protein